MIVLSHFCFEDFFFFQAWDNNVVFHQIKKNLLIFFTILSHVAMPCVSFLQGTFPTSHYRPGTGVETEEFFDTKVRGPCPPEYHGLVGEANA